MIAIILNLAYFNKLGGTHLFVQPVNRKLSRMNQNYFRPKKSLGQNFLQDENIARKIIRCLSLNPANAVIEIGPGKGILTKYLLESGCTVIAVEIDKNMVGELRRNYSHSEKLQIVHDDFLKVSLPGLLDERADWKVVGNLPYHITSQVLFRIFENAYYFSTAVFMVQKEVARRIIAKPNSKDFGILSIFSQFYAEVKKMFDVSSKVFFPIPDVTSSVVRWDFRQRFRLSDQQMAVFRTIVKKVFSQRRKMLRNSLKTIKDFCIDMNKLNFDLTLRPEQLSVKQFIELTKQITDQQTQKN